MARLDCSGRSIRLTWSVPSLAVSNPGHHPRLVDGNPPMNPVTERTQDNRGKLAESLGCIARVPAAAVLEGLRQVPVMQGHVRFDGAFQQRVDQAVVKVKAFLIDCSSSVGKNSGPGDGKTVAVYAEPRHEVDVIEIAVVVVAGNLAGVTLKRLSRCAGEPVPDTFTSTILVGRALNLIGCRCRAEVEVCRKQAA